MVSVVNLDGGRVRVPAAALEHEGFRAWVKCAGLPEGVRAHFIEGEVFIEMSPESIETHNKVKQAIFVALLAIVEEDDLGELFLDGVLVSNPDAALSSEPDVFFVSWRSFEEEQVRLTPKAGREGEYVEIEGTPDLVVEIVSDTSVRKDTTLLREAYRRAGVSEYWLVDARGANIEFQILDLSADGYAAAAPVGAAQRSRVLGRAFELTRARNRAGRFRYRLGATR